MLVGTFISWVNAHSFFKCSGFQQATSDHFIRKKTASSNNWRGSMSGPQMRRSHRNRQAEEKPRLETSSDDTSAGIRLFASRLSQQPPSAWFETSQSPFPFSPTWTNRRPQRSCQCSALEALVYQRPVAKKVEHHNGRSSPKDVEFKVIAYPHSVQQAVRKPDSKSHFLAALNGSRHNSFLHQSCQWLYPGISLEITCYLCQNLDINSDEMPGYQDGKTRKHSLTEHCTVNRTYQIYN